jgi:hypothetical protein
MVLVGWYPKCYTFGDNPESSPWPVWIITHLHRPPRAFIVQMVFNDLGSWTPQLHVGFSLPFWLGAPPNWSWCDAYPTWLQLNGRAYHSTPPLKDLHPCRYSNMLRCHDEPFFHHLSTKPFFGIITYNFRYIRVKHGFHNHKRYLKHFLCSFTSTIVMISPPFHATLWKNLFVETTLPCN